MKSRSTRTSRSLLVAVAIALPLRGIAAPPAVRYVPDPDPLVRQRLKHWRDLKFGLLMHWGIYSQLGIVESWSICPEDEGWCVPKTVDDYFAYKTMYENLPTTFNPTRFDPVRWARAAKAAGMKYVVFTTKHHDGFCMYDSKYTDYKITGPRCAFAKNPQADVTRAIFNAFRARGFWIGAYFSKADWHSPDYWWPRFPPKDRYPNYDVARHPRRWARFVKFTHDQVMELCRNYGRIDILWLDADWVKKVPPPSGPPPVAPGYTFKRIPDLDLHMGQLVADARRAQPGLIVVDRDVPGKYQDYLTPENRVPDRMLPYPWESCIPMGDSWSYSLHPHYKSPRQLIHLLADIVAKGGNLLLNIGPGPDGRWHRAAYQRLAAMGAWLRINGQAIYGTRVVAPYFTGPLRFTRGKDGSRYVIYLLAEGQTSLPAVIGLPGFQPPARARVTILGAPGATVRCVPTAGAARLLLSPAARTTRPSPYAVTFKLTTS